MATYGQDSDFVQWTLQLFESNPYSSFEYCTLAQDHEIGQDNGTYYGHYCKEDEYDEGCYSIENDELLAHVLQEELSQLAVAETPETPRENVKRMQICRFHQGWIDQNPGSFFSGQDCEQEEVDDGGPSSSCSSPEENTYNEEDWSSSLDLCDEYGFDGEVGKRLNQMVPIPHVPRINGEIPSLDEATLDHQRLLDRLQLYDLYELKVQGDGNCQFRALSDQFYRTPEHHEFVRQQVVNQLESHSTVYEGYVPMAFGDYLEKMSRSGEWGDHVTLQAASDLYGVKIFVITSFKDTCYIEILPNVQRSNRVIFLSFWAEVHYNSIHPHGEIPTFRTKKKKKWRMFRSKQLECLDE